jgi:hypothetical protein
MGSERMTGYPEVIPVLTPPVDEEWDYRKLPATAQTARRSRSSRYCCIVPPRAEESRRLAPPVHGGDYQRLRQHDGQIGHSANLR